MNFIKKLLPGKQGEKDFPPAIHSADETPGVADDPESVSEGVVHDADQAEHVEQADARNDGTHPAVDGESPSDEAARNFEDSSAAAIPQSSGDTSPESIFATDDANNHGGEDFFTPPVKRTGLADRISAIFGRRGTRHAPEEEFGLHIAESTGLVDEAHDRDDAAILAEIGRKPQPLKVIGSMSPMGQYRFGASLLMGFLMLSAGTAYYGMDQVSQATQREAIATKIQMLSQRLLASSQTAIRGDVDAISQMSETRQELAREFETLRNGDETVRALDVTAFPALGALEEDIQGIFRNTDAVLNQSPALSAMNKTRGQLDEASRKMFLNADQLQAFLSTSGPLSMQVAAADHIRLLAERLRRTGGSLLGDSSGDLVTLTDFLADAQSLAEVITALSKGDAQTGMAPVTDAQAARYVKGIQQAFGDMNDVSSFLGARARDLLSARDNQSRLAKLTDAGLRDATKLAEVLGQQAEDNRSFLFASAGLLLLSILSLFLIALINNRQTRIEAWETAYGNKVNERDIIKFMEDIFPLEMGDLTVQFTRDPVAMEGITGGIRSSVSEAVGSLREAVSTVKETTGSVSQTVEQSVRSSEILEESNQRQAMEIGDVVERVERLTNGFRQVTEDTLRASEVTTAAKEASDAGAEVVGQTNRKMTEIRGSMQDVLKSVKHLGETSHEIGTIVGTIENITDMTQVISVNASLEAAKAGAAGRGFQVLAGEVNRLAEKSAEALRTITALVQRIQGETAATIKTVEDSTSSVVQGAQLAEAANTELGKIASLSEQLYAIMSQIREQSQSQSLNAEQVRESMDRLLRLSTGFQESVTEMVAGVQQIDQMMSNLQNTVRVFSTDEQKDETA